MGYSMLRMTSRMTHISYCFHLSALNGDLWHCDTDQIKIQIKNSVGHNLPKLVKIWLPSLQHNFRDNRESQGIQDNGFQRCHKFKYLCGIKVKATT